MPFDDISVEWEELKHTLQGCEDSLMVASRLQSFIQVQFPVIVCALHQLFTEIKSLNFAFSSVSYQDLDSFLTWLVQTQTVAASDQLPNDLEEAETLINKHAALKEEIGRWAIELLPCAPHFQTKKTENATGVQ